MSATARSAWTLHCDADGPCEAIYGGHAGLTPAELRRHAADRGWKSVKAQLSRRDYCPDHAAAH